MQPRLNLINYDCLIIQGFVLQEIFNMSATDNEGNLYNNWLKIMAEGREKMKSKCTCKLGWKRSLQKEKTDNVDQSIKRYDKEMIWEQV